MRWTCGGVLWGVVLVGCTASTQPPPAAPAEVGPNARAATFREAYAAFQHGRLQESLTAFSTLATSDSVLADHDLYFVGVIQSRLHRPRAAEAALGRVLDAYPESIHAPSAALLLGQMALADGRLDRARAWLAQAAAAPDRGTALAARYAAAQIEERAGSPQAAYDGFMAVRKETAGSALGLQAREHVVVLRAQWPSLEPAGPARLEEARLLLTERDFAAAQALATRILDDPQGTDPADAMRVRADALQGLGQFDAAVEELRQVATVYPRDPDAPPALFRAGTLLWNHDRDAEARQAFEDLLQRYPTDKRTAEARYAVGRIYQQAGDLPAAVAAFDELAAQHPGDPLAVEGRWRVGWMRYVARDWSGAAAVWNTVAATSQPRQRSTAAYWQARALAHAGSARPARELYEQILEREPDGYYALWAERRLDGTAAAPLLAPAPGSITPAPLPETPPLPAGVSPFHPLRYAALRDAGAFDLARGELGALERAQGAEPPVALYLVEAYRRVDGYAAAWRLARRYGADMPLTSGEEEQLAYPLAFWPTVSRASETHGLDPLLVLALMRQESLFDPDATSPADARGLMQLLPSTAHRVVGTAGTALGDADLYDPETNITLGTRYLSELLARYQGDAVKAVAAYNGGEAAVDRWTGRATGLEPDEFVETISYRETRDYVKRVLGNYRAYRRLYAGAS
jgi:soluble lytic murein transglycosylase